MLIVFTEGSPATEGCFSQRSAQPCSHSQHTNHALARTARLGLCLYRPSVQKPWKKERKKHSAASFGDEQAQLHRVGHPSHCSFLPQVVQLPGEATSHPRPLHPAPASTEKKLPIAAAAAAGVKINPLTSSGASLDSQLCGGGVGRVGPGLWGHFPRGGRSFGRGGSGARGGGVLGGRQIGRGDGGRGLDGGWGRWQGVRDVVVQEVVGALAVEAVRRGVAVRHHLLHLVVRLVPGAGRPDPRQGALEWQRGRVAPPSLPVTLPQLLLFLG